MEAIHGFLHVEVQTPQPTALLLGQNDTTREQVHHIAQKARGFSIERLNRVQNPSLERSPNIESARLLWRRSLDHSFNTHHVLTPRFHTVNISTDARIDKETHAWQSVNSKLGRLERSRPLSPPELTTEEAEMARTAQRCIMEALDHSKAAAITLESEDGTPRPSSRCRHRRFV
jgi:hypothetical protein